MNNSGGFSLGELVEKDAHLLELSEYLDGGGNPNQNVHGSNTLLHVAAQSKHINERIIRKLVDAGANIDATTSQGHTPLQFAVMSRNLGAVQVLLLAGAHINGHNFFGRTALHYAVDSHHPNTRRFHRNDNPDMWAYGSHARDTWIIKRLLENENTDVNPVDSNGETPLMWAVRLRFVDAVKTLLDNGANPSIPDQRGQNCLHMALASRFPNRCIITCLLLSGTSIYDADNYGRTPIDFLLGNYLNNSTFDYVKDLLRLIAFKYRIRKDLEFKVRRIPELFEHLKKCVQEVQWMSKQIIYDEMTLHDFAGNCFPEPPRTEDAEDTVLDICRKVVEILLRGSYEVYLKDILDLISKRNFCAAVESIVSHSFIFQDLMTGFRSSYSLNYEIFPLFQLYYQLRNNEEQPVYSE